MVRGDAFENARKRTGLDRLVVGNDLVMLAVAWGCHSHVRSLLPSNIVAENPQSLDELRPATSRGNFIAPRPRRARNEGG